MTIKEAKEWLAQYPDDAHILSRVSARGFQEDLIFSSSNLEEKDENGMKNKYVHLDFGFEIGWRNSHPEFQ